MSIRSCASELISSSISGQCISRFSILLKIAYKKRKVSFWKNKNKKGKKKIIIVHDGHRRKIRECVHTVHYQHTWAQIHSWSIKPIFLLVYNLLLVLYFFFHLVIDPRESWYHSTTSKPYSSKILPALSKASPSWFSKFRAYLPYQLSMSPISTQDLCKSFFEWNDLINCLQIVLRIPTINWKNFFFLMIIERKNL